MRILLYDTTLRDGTQQEGLSLSVDDKLKIASLLDQLGVDYIEGGWPGSNPKDAAFFERVAELSLHRARVSAFGSTRRADRAVEDDPSVRALIAARTPVVAVVGKSWRLHVDHVLGTTATENLRMIGDTVRYLRDLGREVIYDAEHFFDGYRDDPAYAMETILAATEAGADTVVLCDTNGGSMPWQVAEAVDGAAQQIAVRLGIHAHNDGGLAVANTLAAVYRGTAHVQATLNGYGERCGNADFCSLLPNLVLKLHHECISEEQLARLTSTAQMVNEIANRRPDARQPYVGRSAFAHKGGMHVDAMVKCAGSYQHIDPKRVGNRQRVVVSELSGKANLTQKAQEFGQLLTGDGDRTQRALARIKDLEHQGFQFEGAEASVDLLLRRTGPEHKPPFGLLDFHVLVRGHPDGGMLSEAAVKVEVGDQVMHTAADGNGPVNALDSAVRKALLPVYPQLAAVRLTDYKVRILDSDAGTAARIRVLITSSDGQTTWSTVGCGTNVIEASWIALSDAFEYALVVADVRLPETVGAEERK